MLAKLNSRENKKIVKTFHQTCLDFTRAFATENIRNMCTDKAKVNEKRH